MPVQILYVEDEPALGRIVKESLESRDFAVRMVADGAEVRTALDDFTPDVAVLDVMLPNRDGYALARDLRQRFERLPILFLTAKTGTDDVLQGFQAGGNDYIRKPFSLEELIVRIQNLLALSQQTGQEPSAREIIRLGRYTFDTQRYELAVDGKSIRLSHREAELLKLLNQHRNFAISRKDILLHLWGDDSFFNSRNLDVYITRLREYLRDDASLQIITLRGVGYHFSVG